jgi:hypothetical protein
MPMTPRTTLRAAILALLGALAAAQWTGCDEKKEEPAAKATAEADQPAVYKLDPKTHLDLLAPEGQPREFELGETRKLPPCHEVFEPQGTVAERFPANDPAERAITLAGCDPEAYARVDGQTLLAYRVPRENKGYHQRYVSYDSDGKLQWDYLIDRSENAENFRANFRSGFIAPLLPRLACAGTLWEGGTRLTCLDATSGEAKFDGLLKFWAGLAPRPHDTSLVTATISGITRRYPYSGVEMRYKALPDSGGRSAFYASDGARLLFVASDSKFPQMTAYGFDDFEKQWITELPARPKSHYDDTAFGEHSVVLAKADGKLFAIDTETGEGLWSADVGDDTPPVAVDEDAMYLLVRRDTKDNLLYSLNPRSGEVHWWSNVPPGTLELRICDGLLFTRSVRAVRHIPTSAAPDTAPD